MILSSDKSITCDFGFDFVALVEFGFQTVLALATFSKELFTVITSFQTQTMHSSSKIFSILRAWSCFRLFDRIDKLLFIY